ncbi:MAG: NUDIX hydrolase [Rhodothermales bacterium]
MTKTPFTASSFEAHIDLLRQHLAGPLPGIEAQLSMAPRYRRDPSMASIEGKPCREAGVLALFFPLDDVPALLLTVRRADLKEHAGQVSFPGGRREPHETLREAALREAHEEVGVAPDTVEVLGTLTPLYIPPTNFCVHPFVGMVPATPTLHPQDDEVETLLRVPLSHLLDPRIRRREPWMLRGRKVEVPYLDVEGHKVWGATAMMLAELLALFNRD